MNDAPAIKEADIGVAMGNGRTSPGVPLSVVLLDSFANNLVSFFIEEGRVIYKISVNLSDICFLCNIGEIVTMFFGYADGDACGFCCRYRFWIVNLVTDGLPAIALGLEPAEKDIMQKPPRKKQEGIFSDGLLSTIVFRSVNFNWLTTLAVFTSLPQ